jgi:transcriptional regulator with XRE-family HTH domain
MPTKLANKKPVPVERKIFATHLRAVRNKAKLTLKELEALTGLSANYIAAVERCVSNISLESMAKLSHALQVPIYCLLDLRFKPDEWDKVAWKPYEALLHQTHPDPLEKRLLAEKTRHYRKALQLTQAQVDTLADFGEATTSGIERQIGNWTLDTLSRLVSILNVPLYQLFLPVPH